MNVRFWVGTQHQETWPEMQEATSPRVGLESRAKIYQKCVTTLKLQFSLEDVQHPKLLALQLNTKCTDRKAAKLRRQNP